MTGLRLIASDNPPLERRVNLQRTRLLKRAWALARAFGRAPARRLLIDAGITEQQADEYLRSKADRRKKSTRQSG